MVKASLLKTAAFLVPLAGLLYYGITEDLYRPVEIGEKAPHFSLPTIAGRPLEPSQFEGRVVVLNFWATWCPPCVAEMPSIAKLHKEMGDQVAFVMLSFDLDFEKAKAFNKRKKYDLPVYAPAADLPDIYNSSDLPTTYIIDASGNLVLTHKGMADYSDPEFRQFLNSLN